MAGSYAFIGHELIGGYVERKLGAVGWERIDDLADAEAVFTYCLGTSALEDAYFDGDGLVNNAPAGMLLVDLSPSTPSFAREISAVATVNDLVFVEAPLVARDPLGELGFSCYAASEERRGVDGALALLEALASPVEVVDAVGNAQLAKAADTVRMTAVLVGAIEADALARASRGAAFAGDEFGDGLDNGLPVELLLADVVAAMTAADDVDLILPQLEAAMHLLELLVVVGGSEMNAQALGLLYSEEEASAGYGLDWTRAEGLFPEEAHDHGHEHGFEGLYDDDEYGYAGGFGGYSAN